MRFAPCARHAAGRLTVCLRGAVFLSLGLGAGLLPEARAQSAGPEDVAAPVVVTATRLSSPLEEPVATQIITAEDIRQSTATTVAEVLSKLGGVLIRNNLLGTDDASIDLHGFGVTGDQNTLVLVNGVRISENELATAHITAIALQSIERIEILRGSGAVLYGGGATGGVINIITRPASGESVNSVGGLVGNLGTQEIRLSNSLSSGGLSLSLDASGRDTENYRDNNEARQGILNLETRFTTDNGFVGLRLGDEAQGLRLPGARTQAQLGTDPQGTNTPNDYGTFAQESVVLFGEYRAGDLRFAADLAYRTKNSSFYNDYGPGQGSNYQVLESSSWDFSPRVNWNAPLAGLANNLLAGIDLAHWSYQNRSAADTASIADPTSLENDTQRNVAFYLQEALQLRPATRLTAGWRIEQVNTTTDVPLSEYGAVVPQTGYSHTLHATDLALREALARGWSVFIRGGQSYRVANVDENRCYFPPCQPLAPQTSKDFSAGTEFAAGALRLRADVFEHRLQNEIYYNDITFTDMNLSPTERRGLELFGRYAFTPDLDVSVSWMYTRATFRNGLYDGVDVSGRTVPVVPRNRGTLLAGWKPESQTRVTFSVVYVGNQYYDNDPLNLYREMPSYVIADFKISRDFSWPARGSQLSLGVNNLLDRHYYSYALVDSATAPTTFEAYPDLPRTVYLSGVLRY
jgi:iron complex outermembrane recepter protein